jgi:hypothetical protein
MIGNFLIGLTTGVIALQNNSRSSASTKCRADALTVVTSHEVEGFRSI